VRVNYSSSAALSWDATLGYEFRQAGNKDFTTPVFGLGATWTPRLGTSLNFAAERRTFNSADAMNTNYTSMSATLTLSQRLGPWVTGSVSVGYENAQYQSTGADGDGARQDSLYQGQIGFTYSVTERWNCSISFSADENRSNQKPLQDYQVAFQSSFRF